jgi:hypothetical protein
MLTTLQVRAIMAKHGRNRYGVYTNRTAGDYSNHRRVKCYGNEQDDLVVELRAVAGVDNVKVTVDRGIVVKCMLAQ